MADADFDGSMPQALLLLNGELTNSGSRAVEGGVLGGILAGTARPGRAAGADVPGGLQPAAHRRGEGLFLPALSTPQAARDRRAYEDSFFALLTSTEVGHQPLRTREHGPCDRTAAERSCAGAPPPPWAPACPPLSPAGPSPPAPAAPPAKPRPAPGPASCCTWRAAPATSTPSTPSPAAPPAATFKAIATSVEGVRISEHLPRLAERMKHLALIRSLTSKEGNHDRARHLMHTSYAPAGGADHPAFGSLVAEAARRRPAGGLPGYVSIGGPGEDSGFLSVGAVAVPGEEPAAPGALPGAGPGHRRRALRPSGWRCWRKLEDRFAAGRGGAFATRPPRGGRAGDRADGVDGRAGVPAGRRARRRCKRPTAPTRVRRRLPDGPPAGRGRRAVRRGDPERLGHPRGQLRAGEDPVAPPWTRG